MNETMTKQEVAESLGVTPRTVEAYVKRGRLPSPVRIGKRVVFFRASVDKALELMQIQSEKPLVAKARSLGVRL